MEFKYKLDEAEKNKNKRYQIENIDNIKNEELIKEVKVIFGEMNIEDLKANDLSPNPIEKKSKTKPKKKKKKNAVNIKKVVVHKEENNENNEQFEPIDDNNDLTKKSSMPAKYSTGKLKKDPSYLPPISENKRNKKYLEDD